MSTKTACKICGVEECYEHCQVAANGCHQADPGSAQAADSLDWIIDFTCRHCGQSGSISLRIDAADIQWG